MDLVLVPLVTIGLIFCLAGFASSLQKFLNLASNAYSLCNKVKWSLSGVKAKTELVMYDSVTILWT